MADTPRKPSIAYCVRQGLGTVWATSLCEVNGMRNYAISVLFATLVLSNVAWYLKYHTLVVKYADVAATCAK
jgi:hypothetical protein